MARRAEQLDPNKLDHTLETENSIKHLEAHYRFEDLEKTRHRADLDDALHLDQRTRIPGREKN